MSNVYVNEPATSGKVCLKTTVGDIDIELWSKECPLACRNFIQLCMEGYYNGTIFHRLVKDFIVQGGDPTGSGSGGESVYGHPFKDEFHQRLKFCRRGLLGMANAGKNSNGSQFFFTLAQTPDLDKTHTLFGKVVGNTLFNMLRLGECDTDENEKPLSTHKIVGCVILNNPFPDIVPRQKLKEKKPKNKKKEKVELKRNLELLSFGDEMEQEEEELNIASSHLKSKSKSAHDLLVDEKLSKEPAVRPEELQSEGMETEDNEDTGRFNRIREKLMKRKRETRDHESNEGDEDVEQILNEELRERRNQELEKLSAELKTLQKSYKKTLKKMEEDKKKSEGETEPKTEGMKLYRSMRLKFKEKSKKIVKQRDPNRESQTMEILQKFTSKLAEWSQATLPNAEEHEKAVVEEETNKELEDTSKVDIDAEDLPAEKCFGHKFEEPLERRGIKQAKDANFRKDSEEWYDLSDPRNKINQRRRGEE